MFHAFELDTEQHQLKSQVRQFQSSEIKNKDILLIQGSIRTNKQKKKIEISINSNFYFLLPDNQYCTSTVQTAKFFMISATYLKPRKKKYRGGVESIPPPGQDQYSTLSIQRGAQQTFQVVISRSMVLGPHFGRVTKWSTKAIAYYKCTFFIYC